MKKIIIIIILINMILIGYTHYHKSSSVSQRNVDSFGEIDIDKLLINEPLQEELENRDLTAFNNDNFSITPVKRYRIAARILAKENYDYEKFHEVVPLDLALGWSEMSDLKTVQDNKITISQSNRFYFWRIPSFDKISRRQIETHSANVHISPINEEVKKELNYLKEKDLIYLEGFLVNIMDKKTGYVMKSSLTREDTGPGACEVMLVTKVKLLDN